MSPETFLRNTVMQGAILRERIHSIKLIGDNEKKLLERLKIGLIIIFLQLRQEQVKKLVKSLKTFTVLDAKTSIPLFNKKKLLVTKSYHSPL